MRLDELQPVWKPIRDPLGPSRLEQVQLVGPADVEADKSRRSRTVHQPQVDDPVATSDIRNHLPLQGDPDVSHEPHDLCGGVLVVITEPPLRGRAGSCCEPGIHGLGILANDITTSGTCRQNRLIEGQACGTVPPLVPITFADQRPPIPPASLVRRVAGHFPANEVDAALRNFDEGASVSVRWLERGLATIGRTLTDFDRLLDFGCGPGRIMRWLGPLADDVELHGVDIDADAIVWAGEHIPYARFAVAPHEPPMPYPDGHFDLVINHSVFTHLDERMQDLWLAELRRVTRSGATVLLTVHGTCHVQTVVQQFQNSGEDPEPYLTRLETDGILFIAEDDYVGSTHPPFYHSTFHAPWYVFEHWHDFFDIRAYIPEGSGTQDLVVLERRPDGAHVAPPVRRRLAAPPSPPQEEDALAHARELHANWPAPRGPLGRLKRRLLRAEIDRYDRLTAALIEAGRQSDAPSPAQGPQRLASVLPAALYQQGERISILEHDLRMELEELGSRLRRLESS